MTHEERARKFMLFWGFPGLTRQERDTMQAQLAGQFAEAVEAELKAGEYEAVVDMHRQYGRENRLRLVCEWLESDPPELLDAALDLGKDYAKLLREKFVAIDDEYDQRDDVRSFENREKALQARIALLEAECEDLRRNFEARKLYQCGRCGEFLVSSPCPVCTREAALEKADANLFHRRKEHISDRCGRMYQTACEVCDSEEDYQAARAKVKP